MWTAPRYSVAPRYGSAFRSNSAPRFSAAPRYGSAFRPAYNADRGGWNRGGRGRYRAPYRGNSGYGAYAYPYSYVNSWELLPWDLGYPDFTGYGDDGSATDQQPEQAEPQPQYAPQPEYTATPDAGYGQEYAPAYQAAAAPAESSAPVTSQPELTLIFQDGHTETIRNYALTPSAVIVMDEAASGREPQIPLKELNLPATQRAARQAGLDFSPPAS